MHDNGENKIATNQITRLFVLLVMYMVVLNSRELSLCSCEVTMRDSNHKSHILFILIIKVGMIIKMKFGRVSTDRVMTSMNMLNKNLG